MINNIGLNAIWHCLSLATLVFVFGFGVYSLSIDVAHHFLLVNFLSTSDPSTIATAPWMTPMAIYPQGAHWITAALGMVIGSPYAAMWILCITGIYIGYYALARLVQVERGNGAVIAFVVLLAMMRPTGALVGNDVIGNFFFSQLVGTSIFFVLLVIYRRIAEFGTIPTMIFGLVGGSVLMWIHLIPALGLLCTFGLLLVIRLFDAFRKSDAYARHLVSIFAYGGACFAVVVLHPSFAAMRELSGNDGALTFPISPLLLLIASILTVALCTLATLWARRNDRTVLDDVVVSAAAASIALMGLQLIALLAGGGGSAYAVKKHLFIVVPLAIVCAARTLGHFVRTKDPFAQQNPIASIAAALFATWLVFPAQPVISIRQVTTPLHYAQNAVLTSFAKFRDGNTAITAESVDPISRYMINLSIFHVSSEDAIGLFREKVDQSKIKYFLQDNIDLVSAACNENYAETQKYVISSSSCGQVAIEGVVYGQTSAGAAVEFVDWYTSELTHRWSAGSKSQIKLRLPDIGADYDRCVSVYGFTLGAQTIKASLDGQLVSTTTLDGLGTLVVPIGRTKGAITIAFDFSNPHQPSLTDMRIIAFALKTIMLSKC